LVVKGPKEIVRAGEQSFELTSYSYHPTQLPMTDNERELAALSLVEGLGLNPIACEVIIDEYRLKNWGVKHFKRNFKLALAKAKNSYERANIMMNPVEAVTVYDYQGACVMWSKGADIKRVELDGEAYWVPSRDAHLLDGLS
jgi:hypothetical protein